MSMRILIIDDDVDLAETLKAVLSPAYLVDLAFTGKTAVDQAFASAYDLLVLDLLLPDMPGLAACQKIRERGCKSPILVLTGQFELHDKVQLLDSGADDYLTKPFETEELTARIRALLRRNPAVLASTVLTVGDLTLNLATRKVQRGKVAIHLRRKEFNLLAYLMRNQGHITTRDMIMANVWDSNAEIATNCVDVHIKYLRDQIDKPFPHNLIKTIHGLGYKIDI